jgi:hypothetical protein
MILRAFNFARVFLCFPSLAFMIEKKIFKAAIEGSMRLRYDSNVVS